MKPPPEPNPELMGDVLPDPPAPPLPPKMIEPDHIYVGMPGAEWVVAAVAGIMVLFVGLALIGALR